VFVDTIPAQHKGLQQVLRGFPADVIIGDNMILGVLPMLLGPRSKRPPIVLCGTSILHWRREDGAPPFVGLPPATTQAQLEEYAAISREHDRVVNQPLARRLKDLGVWPLSTTVFDAVVELADAYMQLTVSGADGCRRAARACPCEGRGHAVGPGAVAAGDLPAAGPTGQARGLKAYGQRVAVASRMV
jgi:hypothetical protein